MYLLFDIGGTKTRIASTSDLQTIERVIKFETPLLFEEAMLRMEAEMTSLCNGRAVTAVAGGIRGPLDHEKTAIVSETILVDWVRKPLAQRLSDICHAPVYLENDTALVGLGEAYAGAGQGYSIVAYHTVSTGVGGARIVDGKIDVARSGFEPGKQVLDIDHTIHAEFSQNGTLEELISGDAVEKRFGQKPYTIPQNDPIWNELALYLAHGIKNTILYWSPDVVVLGGSMVIGDPRIMLELVIQKVKELLGDLEPCPPIVDATLKDEGGLHGALALLRQKEMTQKND